MYPMLVKKVDKIIERARYENKLDHERLMKSYEREDSVNKSRQLILKKLKKTNQDWLDRSIDMKTHKTNALITTRNHYLEKISRRENSVVSNRSNLPDLSVHKVSDNLNQKLKYVKMNIDKQNKEIERDRNELHFKILTRIKSISKSKKLNMLNISKTIHNEVDEKMKKIHKSTEMIKKQEQVRLKEIETRKLNKFVTHHYNISNIKENKRRINEKEKLRYSNVQENVDHINKSLFEKQDNMYAKLNQKYSKQRENMRSNSRFEEFLSKRRESYDRFYENSLILSQFDNSRNEDIIKSQHYRNSRSVDRNRSLNTSKGSIRESVTSSHLDLKKRLEKVYSRLNHIGEHNILRKKPQEQKGDYKELVIRKQEEMKLKEEKEMSKYQGGGLFKTEVRF